MFIIINAFIKPTNISFVFHNYRNYFMAFLVIFEISVMISTIIFPLIRAKPQAYVVLSRSLTIIWL